MADVINLDGDIAGHNSSSLHQTAAELATPSVASEVIGNRTEPVASRLTDRFEFAGTDLGTAIENLRAKVAAHADALTHAVQALRERDQMTASDAGKTTALIDELAAAPAAASNAPTSSAQSRTASAFGAV